jgi:hypothetical protein
VPKAASQAQAAQPINDDAFDKFNNLNPEQLDSQINMMRNNKEAVRTQYKTQFGLDLSDAQLENMLNMMNPQTLS